MKRFLIAATAVALAAQLGACGLSGPSSLAARDAAVAERVKAAIDQASGPSPAAVEVVATGGVVTLYGTVEVPNESEHVALVASGVNGVRSVVNDLIVIRGS